VGRAARAEAGRAPPGSAARLAGCVCSKPKHWATRRAKSDRCTLTQNAATRTLSGLERKERDCVRKRNKSFVNVDSKFSSPSTGEPVLGEQGEREEEREHPLGARCCAGLKPAPCGCNGPLSPALTIVGAIIYRLVGRLIRPPDLSGDRGAPLGVAGANWLPLGARILRRCNGSGHIGGPVALLSRATLRLSGLGRNQSCAPVQQSAPARQRSS